MSNGQTNQPAPPKQAPPIISPQAPPGTQSSAQIGSAFQNIHMMRDMLVFPVNESEISSLARDNTLARKFNSVSASLASSAIAILISWAFTKDPTPIGDLLLYVIAPLCLVGAWFYRDLALDALKEYNSTWDRIRKESRPIIVGQSTSPQSPGTAS